jgi:hypothetical protein
LGFEGLDVACQGVHERGVGRAHGDSTCRLTCRCEREGARAPEDLLNPVILPLAAQSARTRSCHDKEIPATRLLVP